MIDKTSYRKNSLPSSWRILLILLPLSAAIADATSFPAWSNASNGISVGRPKVFDNRTLQIMLEQLNDQLQTVRAVDQQKLLQSLLLQQGAEISDVERALLLTTPVQPKVETKEQKDEAGNLVPSERTTTQEPSTASAPTLPDLIAAPAYSPTFGSSAPDLLADQISLSYQIFNVRMLLERSLTDRLWNGEPRLQAVLGFQVSLDPPERMRDHAAFVEVTVTSRCGKPVELVALMPFEKTYNSSALSNRASDFGGSAVARILTLGYRERRRQQIFYLFKDADTLALEDLRDPSTEGTTFGWTFRPVLGRRSVNPGTRQMFAVISLPTEDLASIEEKVEVRVRTYWRRYERRTLTTEADEVDEKKWENPSELSVYSSQFVEQQLAPVIENVEWAATGTESAVVTIRGRNFFTGTKVHLGTTTYDSQATGLVIKSDQTIELRTTQREIALGDAVLSGRYAGPLPIYMQPSRPRGTGILINSIEYLPDAEREKIALTIDLQERNGQDLQLDEQDRPLVVVSNTYIPGPYWTMPVACDAITSAGIRQSTCVRIETVVPSNLLSTEAIVSVRIPFQGVNWSFARLIDAQREPKYKIIRLGGDDQAEKLAVEGKDFNDNWKVQLDNTYEVGNATYPMERLGKTLFTFKVQKATLSGYKRLVLVPPNGPPRVLEIPASTPASPKPALDGSQAMPHVTKSSSTGVPFKGVDLGAIQKAWFEGKELAFRVDDGTKITIFVTREVTKETGRVSILLETSNGSKIPAELLVVP